LQPGTGPAAQIQHPVTGRQQAEALVEILELEDRAGGEAPLARLLEVGVVPLATIAER
jgi:hypothetical protein